MVSLVVPVVTALVATLMVSLVAALVVTVVVPLMPVLVVTLVVPLLAAVTPVPVTGRGAARAEGGDEGKSGHDGANRVPKLHCSSC